MYLISIRWIVQCILQIVSINENNKIYKFFLIDLLLLIDRLDIRLVIYSYQFNQVKTYFLS